MSWKDTIRADTTLWSGVVDYANERIADLTKTCISPSSSDAEIRAAQASILEMQRLLAVPQMIKSTITQRGAPDQTRGY